MNNKVVYKDVIAFHPGYYIQDLMDEWDITQHEFAVRLGTTDKTMSKLLHGEIPLSNTLAKSLSFMTGTGVAVWLNLQKKFEEKCCIIDQEKELDAEINLLKDIDYSYFSKLGVVPETKNKKEQVRSLQSFFKISSLEILRQVDFLVACRTAVHDVEIKHVMNANAWIQTGINMAQKIECKPFDKAKLKSDIPRLRAMTKETGEAFLIPLKQLLASCGIALVFLPYLKNSGLNGAVKWIQKDKVLLLVNDRGKDAGQFWFSLFHELGHIVQEKRKQVYLTASKQNEMTFLSLGRNNANDEAAADAFANESLIPAKKYKIFSIQTPWTEKKIQSFAEEIGISTEIVLGRLQHDKKIPWNQFSGLRKKYKINMNN